MTKPALPPVPTQSTHSPAEDDNNPEANRGPRTPSPNLTYTAVVSSSINACGVASLRTQSMTPSARQGIVCLPPEGWLAPVTPGIACSSVPVSSGRALLPVSPGIVRPERHVLAPVLPRTCGLPPVAPDSPGVVHPERRKLAPVSLGIGRPERQVLASVSPRIAPVSPGIVYPERRKVAPVSLGIARPERQVLAPVSPQIDRLTLGPNLAPVSPGVGHPERRKLAPVSLGIACPERQVAVLPQIDCSNLAPTLAAVSPGIVHPEGQMLAPVSPGIVRTERQAPAPVLPQIDGSPLAPSLAPVSQGIILPKRRAGNNTNKATPSCRRSTQIAALALAKLTQVVNQQVPEPIIDPHDSEMSGSELKSLGEEPLHMELV
ncbi:hypothetical protein PCANC_22818 [Puccinia coronata f. sp. avenae]|uniref:Uncharacterized protein n=1 Tax=Puccinia coronata f. sp. avenae TaxID=200324 RepID=A0A2N5UDC0_9BASI|nr:hypothetical protein PCASD_26674 [Puccinia coronata f. sp. avenae]PLW35557.1 hypothetical protein PCANC_22818 [Puccinia coronata f. sp. avenae]PLW35763.1 hypothetical protein PCASD_20645 [Puccinia coronata f. sp. avenae]